MILSGFSMTERAIELEVAVEGRRDALDYASYLLLVIGILGILASLKFMADVRNPTGTKDRDGNT